MTELGEFVAGADLDSDGWECPFSHRAEQARGVANRLTNDPALLGRNMGGDQAVSTAVRHPRCQPDKRPAFYSDERGTLDINRPGYDFKVRANAHHLIPGDASLPRSDVMDYVSQERGVIQGDIGYDVNGCENGAWLPSNNAVADWGALTMTSKSKRARPGDAEDIAAERLQTEYAYRAMELGRAQFHDSHEDYNGFVVRCLNKIAARYTITAACKCEACQDCLARDGKLPPPYALVQRLNVVSTRLRGLLSFPPERWREPVFTSSWAMRYRAIYGRAPRA